MSPGPVLLEVVPETPSPELRPVHRTVEEQGLMVVPSRSGRHENNLNPHKGEAF